MPAAESFTLEAAPELPGSERLFKCIFGAIRQSAPRLWDLEIEGRDNIPDDGPAIITPNHLSFCDSIFVPAALPRRVWAVGKGEYMDSWKTRHIFPAMGMIPVDRSGGDAAQAALDTAAKVLDNGLLFMIYPEGTRSRSGFLHKGRTGAARLALRCDAPIIPTGHSGTLDVQPPDTFVMKPNKKVTVRFGEPMWLKDYGPTDDPRTLRRFTDAVMFEIAQLSEQKYVDVYAGKDDSPGHVASMSPVEQEQPSVTPPTPSVVGTTPPKISRPSARPVAAVVDGSIDDRVAPAVPPIKLPPGRVRHSSS